MAPANSRMEDQKSEAFSQRQHLPNFSSLVALLPTPLGSSSEDHLEKVRTAMNYLSKQFPSRHPMADQEFVTDGLNLFIKKFSQLINISQEGQLAIQEVLQAHLHRIERDLKGIPVRLYPFTRKRDLQEEPRAIVIDPQVSFGRPVLAGTGIPTAVIAERYKAGESVDDLADDYGRRRLEIEEAIRCELSVEAA